MKKTPADNKKDNRFELLRELLLEDDREKFQALSEEIIQKEKFVPVSLFHKTAIVDEAYFLMGNISQELQKAIYDYAMAINKFLKSK